MAPDAPATVGKLKVLMSSDTNSAVRQVAQLAAHQMGGSKVAMEPATVSLATSVEPGGISMAVEPVHLFEMLDSHIRETEEDCSSERKGDR
jgi:hypothetical protein